MAKSALTNLDQMLLEDQGHSSPTGKLTDDQQARELLWKLQDQVAVQYTEPGYASVFGMFYDPSRPDSSPAGRLAAMGTKAVPALIDGLRDKRFIRGVSGEYGVRTPMRVRDAAIQILNAIACRRFSEDSEGVRDDSDTTATKIEAKVRMWWALVQSKGEDQALAEFVRKGDWPATNAARKLVGINPDLALTAISVGIAEDKENQGTLLAAELSDFTTEPAKAKAQALARQLMNHGKSLDMRFAAAKVVFEVDSVAAIHAAEVIWKQVLGRSQGDSPSKEEVASFLVESGHPDAIDILRASFVKVTPRDRVNILFLLNFEAAKKSGRPRPTPVDLVKCNRKLEDLLATQLTDDVIAYGAGMSTSNESFDDPRVCDIAMYELSEHWPNKYRFTHPRSQLGWDQACRMALNTYRKSRGLHPMPNISVEPVVAAPVAQVSSLLDQLESGRDSNGARNKLFALGPRAIPTLSKIAASLPAADARKKAALDAASQIACLVREVRLVNIPAHAREFAAQAAGLKGRTLSTSLVKKLISSAVERWPSGARAVTLEAHRNEDGRGIIVSLDLGTAPELGGSGGEFNFETGLNQNGVRVNGGSSGTGSADGFLSDEGGPEFWTGLKKLLEAPPFVPFSFYIAFERGR